MSIDKHGLTAELARESGNILLIVAARMVRLELFTPMHYLSELPQKVVSMRAFREALERSEETLKSEVCKIVDGHNRMDKKLRDAEVKLKAAEARIAELEAREVELPPLVDCSNVPFAAHSWNAYRAEAVKALRAAGISVKGE